jgi:energy-converting hydrogenase Eha subunit G
MGPSLQLSLGVYTGVAFREGRSAAMMDGQWNCMRRLLITGAVGISALTTWTAAGGLNGAEALILVGTYGPERRGRGRSLEARA